MLAASNHLECVGREVCIIRDVAHWREDEGIVVAYQAVAYIPAVEAVAVVGGSRQGVEEEVCMSSHESDVAHRQPCAEGSGIVLDSVGHVIAVGVEDADNHFCVCIKCGVCVGIVRRECGNARRCDAFLPLGEVIAAVGLCFDADGVVVCHVGILDYRGCVWIVTMCQRGCCSVVAKANLAGCGDVWLDKDVRTALYGKRVCHRVIEVFLTIVVDNIDVICSLAF